ncbi:MAG: SusC/RagA family TonB-linked outer membrane protein [Gemmatimonadota bacterium]
MKRRVLAVAVASLLFAVQAFAQQRTITGRVTNDQGTPLSGVQIVIKGTGSGTLTNTEGRYSINAVAGQVLQFSFVGTAPVERTVGSANLIDVELKTAAISLDAIEVTALGETTARRALGTAQQTVQGVAIAQTQRENFINALAGRVAGVDVTSTSGVPGASTSIVIRGVSSISSSNQPLMIIDGLPIDNKTLNSGVLASDAPGSAVAFNNRGVDYTNRAADFNPEDIESLTVLKGPEAAALYGIDAANGAIVITTKRGKAGVNSMEYSNSIRLEATGGRPEIQQKFGPSSVGSTTFLYYGDPYPEGTRFFDNVSGFFQTAVTQKHNLSFSGGTADARLTYRVAASTTNQTGVIRNTKYDRINVTGSSRAQVTDWLKADVMMQYSHVVNDQPYKGTASPLIGLLVWPDTVDAKQYLTPAGTRLRLTSLSEGREVDNPYFSLEKNRRHDLTNRINVNFGLTFTPFTWGNLKTNIGVDNYTTQLLSLRHPESTLGASSNGILDETDDITRNINAQTLLNFNPVSITQDLSISGTLGNQITDNKSTYNGLLGRDFLDPNFVSMNNTNLRSNRTTISQRRLVGLFGKAVLDYKHYLYVTLTGRNDWTSTIPQERNSFFYPSVSTSFVFSDAIPGVRRFVTGKVRAAWAEVGRDARPYAFRPALEFKPTSFGGYGYSFWGPNLNLRPEFARSYEFGAELSFLNDRLGLDATWFRKQTEDQIVDNIRGSYATGFILFNLNGASTRNEGLELMLRGTPVLKRDFSWDVLANFTSVRGEVLSLPNELPESYNSDTWLYGNVRNGVQPGQSTMSLTGMFYRRVESDSAGMKGAILIDPTSGLPVRHTTFVEGGYDRQPDFTVGVTNSFRYKRLAVNFLAEIRKGGDVFNATQHFLTARGLTPRTLDREEPRVIKGVLRDGKQDSPNPTINTIVVRPVEQTSYYTGMSEELFIEKDINWLRLRDVTVSYAFPAGSFLRAKSTSVYVTATDLFLLTNYSGLDPIVNGNTAALGGSGGVGIDYANFPMPRGINVGFKLGF